MKADYVHKDTLTATDYVELNKNNELLMSYNQALLKENQKLQTEKEQINSLVNSCQEEIRRLKKQLEEINKMIEKCGFVNIEQVMLNYCGLLSQQKEFIEYLESEIKGCNNYSKYIENKVQELKSRSVGKTYIANEIMKNEVAKKILKEILSKFKEIIGSDKDEN